MPPTAPTPPTRSRSRFWSPPPVVRGGSGASDRRARCGVLLANLGTPDAPTPSALRRYLREFLLDPRVIELPRALWWAILHLFVLPTRPRTSAALYRQIWTTAGSPLLVTSQRLATELAPLLAERAGEEVAVVVGMRYGQPSAAQALRALAARGVEHLVILPLYPQYSAATIGSTFDAVAAELVRWRFVPTLTTIHGYHAHPAYIAALAASVRDAWGGEGPPERLLFSFHGLPRRYAAAGDPYPRQCEETAQLLAGALGLPNEKWLLAYQSRFGREEWLRPYSDETVTTLGKAGTASLDVLCPGFAVDCLETLEEIAGLNRGFFTAAGGGSFRYLPALNDRPAHLALLAELAAHALAGLGSAAPRSPG